MKISKRAMGFTAGAVAAIGLSLSAIYVSDAAPSITGFEAKMLCSGVFVSKRHADEIYENDIRPLNPFMGLVSRNVDLKQSTVQTSLLGFAPQRASYKNGVGCALGRSPQQNDLLMTSVPPADLARAIEPRLAASVDRYMRERTGTRAVVVLRDGVIVAQRYRGIDPSTAMPGWSITKSLTSALAGRWADSGILKLDDAALPPSWLNSRRKQVSYRQLLTQTAGQPNDDDVDPRAPLVKMLYSNGNVTAGARAILPTSPPDTTWAYSNADVNLLSAALKFRGASVPGAYARLAPEFFRDVGMASATLETDATGVYVGSTSAFATALDWARFGQLFLDDGVVGEKRVLSSDWIAFSKRPTALSNNRYGALWWLNAPAQDRSARKWPDAPSDTFAAAGQFGQMIAVIPSRKLVIVRLGQSPDWNFDRDPDRLMRLVLVAESA